MSNNKNEMLAKKAVAFGLYVSSSQPIERTTGHSFLAGFDSGLLAAAHSTTVTTAEELNALPVGSVVVDASGTARMNRHGDSHMGGGWTHAGRHPLKSTELANGRPMTVVHRGHQYRPTPPATETENT
jgi:hypothetical protein